MRKTNRNEALEREAHRLLRSPRFFRDFLDAVRSGGLVGEEKNALVVLLVAISRLLAHPVNLFIKGPSSSGKNFLADSVLRFFPPREVEQITSSSGISWNYLRRTLEHRIVYVKEQNKAAGSIHPARLLISENELVRMVSVRSGRSFKTVKEVTKGPVACISTTTKSQLEIDDETRHVSIWTDSSPEQTRRILEAQMGGTKQIDAKELAIWHEVQNLLAARAKLPIEFGDWAKKLVKEVWTGDVRVRRYFEAFQEVCKVVCLVRSFRFKEKEAEERGRREVGFVDFAIASLIFDTAFSQSLSYADDEDRELHGVLKTISKRKEGAGVEASELAKELSISQDRAYARLRDAFERGTVRRSNEPERGNRKLFLPAAPIRMLPDPAEVFEKIGSDADVATFVHPITGEVVVYRRYGEDQQNEG